MVNNHKHGTERLNRRLLVKGAGVGAMAAIAGCLGDDDDVVDDADDVDDVDDVDDTDVVDDVDDVDPADDADDADDEEPVDEIERFDVTAVHTEGPPVPADANLFHWGEPTPRMLAANKTEYRIADRSFADNQTYGVIIDDWDYQPGILEYWFHDDFYWWDGDVLTAQDMFNVLELQDYHAGGDDLDAHENIVTYDLIDDFTIRYTLADSWREEFALLETIVNGTITFNRNFSEPWLEQYRDAPDLDAVEDLRDELANYRIDPDHNPEEVTSQFHIPFEFRYDGSLGDVGESYWEFELVPEKNGNKRHFVDDINFTRYRTTTEEDEAERLAERFRAGEEMFLSPLRGGIIGEDYDFPTTEYRFFRDFDQWSFHFDWELHPADNLHFRRAWAYFCDQTSGWQRPESQTPEIVGPFLGDGRNRDFISDDVLAAFTDYGYDQIKYDEAEQEMEEGGFERDADGRWLLQEDSTVGDAGEPIELIVGARDWMAYVADLGTDFFMDFADFGIQAEAPLAGWEEDMPVIAGYHGGGIPEAAFGSAWGTDSLGWANPNINAPSVVEAPAVGEAAVAGDWHKDDWIEYETRAISDRLPVTLEADVAQQMIDELSWVWNQLVPRFSPDAEQQVRETNDDYWELGSLEEHPRKWVRIPEDDGAWTGLVRYVGPDPDE